MQLETTELRSSQNLLSAIPSKSETGTTSIVRTKCRRHRLDPYEEKIFQDIQEGATLKSVAKEMGETEGALYYWVMLDDARKGRLARVRQAAAAAMVDETLEIADNSLYPVEDRKLKIQTRQWIASRTDRETWGEQQKAAVEVNIDILGVLRDVKQQIIDITP